MTFATVAVQNRYTAADLSDLSWFWSGADAPGFFAVQQTCPHCQGRGTLIKDPCNKCHGHGRVERSKTLSVKIPAGWTLETASVLRAKVKRANTAHRQATCTFRFRLNSTRFSSVKATTCIAKSRSTSLWRRWAAKSKCRPLMVALN